jgi:hypothetical protein
MYVSTWPPYLFQIIIHYTKQKEGPLVIAMIDDVPVDGSTHKVGKDAIRVGEALSIMPSA